MKRAMSYHIANQAISLLDEFRVTKEIGKINT